MSTLQAGVKALESRRITTSHQGNPWFAVDRGSADERQGEVWFGVLAWSGNWKLLAEVTDVGLTRLAIGINDWDFTWRLQPGETFTTPGEPGRLYLRRFRRGFAHAARLCPLHPPARAQAAPRALQLVGSGLF